ncbi:hypothetical protein C8Q75DRAFT_712191 [Abortiporus biennis]|nr:hypothetical protein C8Q75DRAFT_712191 [Abortiporus biennis]
MARTNNTLSNGNTARVARPHLQTTLQRARTYSQSQSRRSSLHGSPTAIQLSWFFRSNIPRRRGHPLPTDVQKRNFFGMGEIIGVLANPSETLRSLTESKKMLEETRRELSEARERAQLTPTHTFSPLPGFFNRPTELKALERTLEGEPSFTILFGASSVGKTALLRQILTRSKYHVLHFDLRIAGFADLASLYVSLSQQMEGFFMGVSRDPDMPGYEEFEKEAWGFKHDRLNVERRMTSNSPGDGAGAAALGEIKTSDVARLMELFQSSLLKYWNFQPALSDTSSTTSEKQGGGNVGKEGNRSQSDVKTPSRLRLFWSKRRKAEKQASQETMTNDNHNHNGEEQGKQETVSQPTKKMPVFFIDEAHKLPALIRSTDAMKCLLDAMLVLTKQDRLCHVIHATSDPFYQTWLRQLNVMQHCKILTIGDYPKLDTRRYFRDRLLPSVPERLRPGLDFEKLYDAFGGKLAHWQDYITDYVNANGRHDIKQSSHFLQAHALLNLHVIHSAQAPPSNAEDDLGDSHRHDPQAGSPTTQRHVSAVTSGSGFRIYSPLSPTGDPHGSPPFFSPGSGAPGSDSTAEFTAIQLLKVMNRLAQPGKRALSYFLLCREMGACAVDGMVRGRILDLRWTDPISREGWDPRVMSMRVRDSVAPRTFSQAEASGSNTAHDTDATLFDPDEEMVALSDEEIMRETQRAWELQGVEEEEEIIGPKLVPITPIMRYAMREVVQEYYDDDDRTVSEYASLGGVEPEEY